MTSWRIDLTVLADLAASMFAACFMVLLIFLSLAQKADTRPPRPIEATQDLNIVELHIPAPGGLVDLLHDHTATEGTSIDLFADHIVVRARSGTSSLRGSAIGSLALADGPVRLYVFSNALYRDVAAMLGARSVVEMSVPRALKGADGDWRPEFLALDAQRAEPSVFRQALARLLKGGTEGSGSAGGGDGMPVQAFGAGLLERIAAFFAAAAAIGLPLFGLGVVLLVERRRYRSGQTIATGGHSAQP